jgi:hypothetical protein
MTCAHCRRRRGSRSNVLLLVSWSRRFHRKCRRAGVSLCWACGSSTLSTSWTGIDWMTLAETVPVTGAIFLIGLLGGVGTLPTLVVAALLGAFLGFDPFNILF